MCSCLIVVEILNVQGTFVPGIRHWSAKCCIFLLHEHVNLEGLENQMRTPIILSASA